MAAERMNLEINLPAGPACGPGEFRFGLSGLDHVHAYGMTEALVKAGGEAAAVFDPDPAKTAAYRERFPGTRVFPSLEALVGDPSLALIACAAVPDRRIETGLAVQKAGKHFLSDKPGFLSFRDLDRARASVEETGRIWAVYYSERVHNEAVTYAGELVRRGAIGRVLNVVGLGPHRMNPSARPEWFFDPRRAGGILTDLASHQIEQFLYFTGAEDARILHARTRNFSQPRHPDFEDFGELALLGPGGESGYVRVDWFTPDGLGTWGDGRVTVLGTEGFLEVRKYIDLARDARGDHVYLANREGEWHGQVTGTVGFPFFRDLIRDCLENTRTAMGQVHTFRVAELALLAQEAALRNG